MTPRQALYWIIQKLGPVPATKRNDNLSYEETQLRESVGVLMDYVEVDEDPTLPDGPVSGKSRQQTTTVKYAVGGYVFDELPWAERYLKKQTRFGLIGSNTKITKIKSETVTIIKESRTQVK